MNKIIRQLILYLLMGVGIFSPDLGASIILTTKQSPVHQTKGKQPKKDYGALSKETIVQHEKQAQECLQAGKLSLFDSVVGETRCHERTLAVIKIFQGLKKYAQLDTCEFIKQFKALDINEVLFINASIDKQFAGNENAQVAIPFDSLGIKALRVEMETLQKQASYGFARNSNGGPYIFVIDHFYASSGQEFLEAKETFELIGQHIGIPAQICDLVMAYSKE